MVFASIYLAAHQRLENLLTLFNLLIWIFARLRAFSLMIILLTGILFACAFLNQVKTASSGPSLTRGRLNGFMCFKHSFLFAIHVEIVFVFTPYFSETLFFVLFPSSVFCKASYFSVIEMFTLLIFHTCSVELIPVYGTYKFLYYKLSNFGSFKIFWSFSGKTLHCLHYKKSVLLALLRCLERKMDLVEKLVTAMNEELPIVTTNSFETFSNVNKRISCLPKYLGSKNWWNIVNREKTPLF